MTTLMVAVAGALVAGGALMMVLGLLRTPVAAANPARARRAGRFHLERAARIRALIGLGIGAAVAVLTGWLIVLVVAPLALVGIPVLVAAPPAQREIDRIEAMEEWVRTLAGSLGAGVGLEQALIRSVRSTPDPIRGEVTALTSRLRARWRTEDALRAFADDLDDATGDLIASNLLLGANRRGGSLSTVLEGLAESVGQDVHNRRDIEADRSKPRSNARIITLITLVVLGGLAVSGDYIVPYGTPLGQVLLLAYLGLYVGMLAWLRKMAQGKPMPRFVGASVREQAT